MKSYTKKSIETKFNCILNKDRTWDTGNKFWTAFTDNNGDIGDYLADAYTLKEVYEQLNALKFHTLKKKHEETTEDYKEELRIFKLGNEQVVKESRIMFKQKLKLLDVIEWVKEQYDSDFSEEEIDNLEPRDSAIYAKISETIKNTYEEI